MYRAMGIHSCIAKSREEYIEIALKLGMDVKFRAEISRAIKDSNSVLFNNNIVVSEFEDFFKSVVDGL
jgi:predicted O-linked N-acetylglucosamine transferase (SPINDLY family)